jgi:hypothetical protein
MRFAAAIVWGALVSFPVNRAVAAPASDETLKAAVVRIEVSKVVTRTTPAGVPSTKLEWYVGSGFWVAGTNRIVTCAHVVEGARRLDVYPYGKWPKEPWSSDNRQISLCLFDRKRDLAVLQVPEAGAGLPLAVSPGQPTDITAVGNVEGYPWRINHGQLTGRQPAQVLGVQLEGDVLVCDVTTGPGASGGIVVDRTDHILGMIEGGKERGIFGTRVAVPSSTILEVLQSVPVSCHASVATGAAILADEETYADLLRIPTPPPAPLARFWAEASYGILYGMDRFDDTVPSLNLDLFRTQTDRLAWMLGLAWAHRTVERSLQSGTVTFEDGAKIDRISILAGPHLRITDFGRVSVFTSLRAGYVHELIQHDYTFTSPLFTPQSYESPASGVLATGGVDVELYVVLNLRVTWSGEVWQGSGEIGNGVGQRIGLRMGIGHGSS